METRSRSTRSGSTFSPYTLEPGLTKIKPDLIIAAEFDAAPLMRSAVDLEDQRFLDGSDDSEGLDVSPGHLSEISIGVDIEGASSTSLQKQSGSALKNATSSHKIRTHRDDDYTVEDIQKLKSPEKKRRLDASSNRRKLRRISKAETSHKPDTYAAKSSIVKDQVADCKSVEVTIDFSELPTTLGGSWVGKRTNATRDTPWMEEELVRDHGFRTIQWDAKTTMIVVDSSKRIMAVFVKNPIKDPDDTEWLQVAHDAASTMEQVRQLGLEADAFSDDNLHHRRGNFLALPVGVSFGGGQTVPGNLVHPSARRILIQKLLDSPSIKRIAGFQSSVFAAYAPKLYKFYATTLSALFGKNKKLLHNFSNSIFPAISFNCGPVSVSHEHVDYGNLSHGLCALTALGNYNPTKGGKIILFNCKVIVEFPSASTALIPSGCVAHGNTPIQDGETRLSIAQYAAGGLFRWVAYGFRSAKSLMKTKAGKMQKKIIDMAAGDRWKLGLEMFSKLDDLVADVEAARYV